MSDIGSSRLPGEAPSGAFRAIAANGDTVNPNEAVFPIVAQESDGRFRLVGTGFFIAENGVFATAKHVLLDVIDRKGNQTAAIGLVQFLPGDEYILRPILRCVSHEIADVAVGVAAAATHNETGAPAPSKLLTLTAKHPKRGEHVARTRPRRGRVRDSSGTSMSAGMGPVGGRTSASSRRHLAPLGAAAEAGRLADKDQ